jgi:hypothetical protein
MSFSASAIGVMPVARPSFELVDGVDTAQGFTAIASPINTWFDLIETGGLASLEGGGAVTNPLSSGASARKIWKANGRGTILTARCVHPIAGTISTPAQIAVFARTLNSEIFTRLKTRAGADRAILAAGTFSDDGVNRATQLDFTNVSWDLMGFNQFCAVNETVIVMSGAAANTAKVEGHLA